MGYEVVWTAGALADVEAIRTHIAERNPNAADRVVADIFQQVDLLQTVPLIGALFPRVQTAKHRELLSGKYRIFYRVVEADGPVVILTVRHAARRDPKLSDLS